MYKKYKLRINSIIVIIISAVLLWFVLKDNFNESIVILKSANWFWVFLCFIACLAAFLIEAFLLKKIINQHKKDYAYKSALKLYLMTKFFNGVTPFSSGGQPLQIYELKKEGVRVTDGTTIIIKHFIIFQTSAVILASFALLMNVIFKFIHCEPFLNTLIVIGYIVNFLLLAIVYFLSIRIKISQKVATFVINILGKFKLIKNKEEKIEHFCNSCLEYSNSYKSLISDKKSLFKFLGIQLLALLFTYSLPIFVFKALGFTLTLNVFVFMIIAVYVAFVGSYIPIPGGTGGMEYAFIGFYSYYVPYTYLTATVLIWRFIDYYLPMIAGGIAFNLERLRRDRTELKANKLKTVN